MTKNPVLNALSAAAYIVIVAAVMTWGTSIAPKGDTFVAPVAAMSIFTLSAAVMGYIFCYEPLQLYFGGKKKEAVNLFLKTILVFGILTAIALGLLFSGAISKQSSPVACTMEAKLCPDGSYVGRIGPKCEFAPCP